MTPAAAIAMLDRQIAAHGQTVTLRKGGAADVEVRAFVRGYRPEELAGGVQQTDSQAILSPTTLGGATVKRLDKVFFDGRLRNVEGVNVVRVGGEPVRYELWLRG